MSRRSQSTSAQTSVITCCALRHLLALIFPGEHIWYAFNVITPQFSFCGILTYDLNFVRGVDFPRSIGDPAGVSAIVLWRQVFQTQSPLLAGLASFLLRKRLVVLQPHDFWSRGSTGHAFETHWASHRTGYHPLPHLSRLGEAGTHCKPRSMEIMLHLEDFLSYIKM